MRLQAAIGLLAASMTTAAVAHAAKPADYGTAAVAPAASSSVTKPHVIVTGASGVTAIAAVSNLPLCPAPGDQSAPVYVPDGNGGGIAVWSDNRSGNYDIYAQKVDANGDPMWAVGGVVVTKATGDQINPSAVADGAGGVIVSWEDGRTDALNPDIYAQRLTAAGVELWTPDGVLVSGTVGKQQTPMIVSDGMSGAIVAWRDGRTGVGDIYARRIPANGVPAWTADGVLVCGATGEQDVPAVVADGAGGAIVAWRDHRGTSNDIYAQRLNSSGTAAWAADGVAVCTAAGDQEPPAVVSDGAGGLILAWGDPRGANTDIYSQRMSAAGAAMWTGNGVALCAATGNQTRARLCQDGASGAVVVWEDRRGANADIYSQRVSNLGAPMWAANGVVVCNAAADQLTPSIAADPTGGAIISWSDLRTPANGADIYVQKVTLAAGAVAWPANGTVVCDTTGDQQSPCVISDGQGGASVAWRDFRGGATADLYSQRVDTTGAVPAQCATLTALTESTPVTATAANSYYTFLQDVLYWSGPAVRSAAGSDWDIELYSPFSFGTTAYPVCFNGGLGGSYQSSVVDFVLGDFNPGYTDLGNGLNLSVRATRYSGSGNGTVEWDAAENTATKDCSGNNCGANSGNNWNQVLDVWDIFLFAGQDYTFDFTKTGSADIRFSFFKPPTGGTWYTPRSGRTFEAVGRFTVYHCDFQGWYGLAFTNENGVNGTYALRVTTGVPTTDVQDGVELATGLRGIIPNPARGAVRLQFGMKQAGDVSMRVIDMAGRHVGDVANQHWNAGVWSVSWDGRNTSGQRLAAGVYFVEMFVNGQRVGRSRLALLR